MTFRQEIKLAQINNADTIFDICNLVLMIAAGNTDEEARSTTATVARAIAKLPTRCGDDQGYAFCVRLSSAVVGLLEAAKPEGQAMPQFLRECGLVVALERLEDSQKSLDLVSETCSLSS